MPLMALVQLSSGFPGWNGGVEHVFNESEGLRGEYNCSRNGRNINFYLLGLSVFAASVEMVFGLGSVSLPWAGLMLAGVCLGCAPLCVWLCFTFSLCQSRWEGPQRGTGHPLHRLISARHKLVAARDGINPPDSEGVNPCGSRRNSTWVLTPKYGAWFLVWFVSFSPFLLDEDCSYRGLSFLPTDKKEQTLIGKQPNYVGLLNSQEEKVAWKPKYLGGSFCIHSVFDKLTFASRAHIQLLH